MQLQDVKPRPGAKKRRKRIGCGESSGHGKTSGKGNKGQKARAGAGIRPGFEGGQLPLVMRLPKIRGFKNPERTEYQPVNVSTINALHPKGGAVTVADLIAKGAVRDGYPVKVLGNGEISVKVTVEAHAFSSSASEKIAAAGGSAKKL